MDCKIKYLVIDVDGTLTDGGVYYDEYGNELKKFCTRDAVGFFEAQKAEINIIVLTGRECKATTRRMQELGVEYLYQNVVEKQKFLKQFMKDKNILQEEIGYIGDDLNDYLAMQEVGYIGCPADSCKEVLECANYISSVKGGDGAVRDIIEHILEQRPAMQSQV